MVLTLLAEVITFYMHIVVIKIGVTKLKRLIDLISRALYRVIPGLLNIDLNQLPK